MSATDFTNHYQEIKNRVINTLDEIDVQSKIIDAELTKQGMFSRMIFKRGLYKQRKAQLQKLQDLKENLEILINDLNSNSPRSFNVIYNDSAFLKSLPKYLLEMSHEIEYSDWSALRSNLDLISTDLDHFDPLGLRSNQSAFPRTASNRPIPAPNEVMRTIKDVEHSLSLRPSAKFVRFQPADLLMFSYESTLSSSEQNKHSHSNENIRKTKHRKHKKRTVHRNEASTSTPSKATVSINVPKFILSIGDMLIDSGKDSGPFYDWAKTSIYKDQLEAFSDKLKYALSYKVPRAARGTSDAPLPFIEFTDAIDALHSNPEYLANLLSEERFKPVVNLYRKNIEFLKEVNQQYLEYKSNIPRSRP